MGRSSLRTLSSSLPGTLNLFLRPEVSLIARWAKSRFDDPAVSVRRLLGEDQPARLPPGWGMNPEGEIRGAWREMPTMPNFWLVLGMHTIALSI